MLLVAPGLQQQLERDGPSSIKRRAERRRKAKERCHLLREQRLLLLPGRDGPRSRRANNRLSRLVLTAVATIVGVTTGVSSRQSLRPAVRRLVLKGASIREIAKSLNLPPKPHLRLRKSPPKRLLHQNRKKKLTTHNVPSCQETYQRKRLCCGELLVRHMYRNNILLDHFIESSAKGRGIQQVAIKGVGVSVLVEVARSNIRRIAILVTTVRRGTR